VRFATLGFAVQHRWRRRGTASLFLESCVTLLLADHQNALSVTAHDEAGRSATELSVGLRDEIRRLFF
jgi:hypothetical protein